MLREYERLRDHKGNPLFKSLLIRNLVAARTWFTGAQGLFGAYPAEFFIQSPKSPRFRPFGQDAKRYFRERIIRTLEQQEQSSMTAQSDPNNVLARRIYRLIGAYVQHRTEERSGIKQASLGKDEQGYTRYPPAYREAREKVAKDAFLAMRGRNGRDFIEYFTGTICAVPQYFGKEDEFVETSQALIESPDTVKDLSMLALSAWSWLPSPKAESQETATQE
jgi:CRISPR-associated protein Cmx8